MAWAILDTSVYINHWERGLDDEALSAVRRAFVIRHSAVVLSELRRGARTLRARRLIDQLFRLGRDPWAPLAADWWEAGLLIQQLGRERHWNDDKRRAFQNDTLIVLTARRHGATVVTANRDDFELLSNRTRVPILVV